MVCHHTGLSLLARCVESLQTSQGVDADIHIVTSADSSTHQQLLSQYGAHPAISVWYEEGGPAHKRNWGTRLAKTDTYVFLDDDVEVAPYTLYELWSFLHEHPRCGMVFAKIRNMERRRVFDDCGSWLSPTGFLFARAQNAQTDTGQYDTAVPCLASKSATCAIRKRAFHAAGGFDATYYILGEETDLAWRCWLRGWEVWYHPGAVSWHAFNTTLKPTPQHYTLERIHFHGAKNYVNLLCTNLGLARLLWTLPCHLVIWVLAAVSFWIRGERVRAQLIMKGLWWNVQTWPRTWTKRRHVQEGRLVPDRYLFRQIAYVPTWGYYWDRLRRYVFQELHG